MIKIENTNNTNSGLWTHPKWRASVRSALDERLPRPTWKLERLAPVAPARTQNPHRSQNRSYLHEYQRVRTNGTNCIRGVDARGIVHHSVLNVPEASAINLSITREKVIPAKRAIPYGFSTTRVYRSTSLKVQVRSIMQKKTVMALQIFGVPE